MFHTRAGLFILIVLITCEDANSQNAGIKFERIGLEHGLSHGQLHDAILQDRQGFLWFATTGGLNKYDGYNLDNVKLKLCVFVL